MENARNYEGLFIVDTEKEESIDEVKSGINAIIKENDGSVQQEEFLGRKTLAYPFDKKTEGIYCLVAFSVDPGKVAKIKRQLELNNDIMRTVITLKKN